MTYGERVWPWSGETQAHGRGTDLAEDEAQEEEEGRGGGEEGRREGRGRRGRRREGEEGEREGGGGCLLSLDQVEELDADTGRCPA